MRATLSLLLLPALALRGGATKEALDAAKARVQQGCHALGLAWPLKEPRILIEKGARRLTLQAEGKALMTYRVGLGSAPELDKEREGDHRTPEGQYYLCSRNPASPFHLFLGVSYPGAAAAERGLRQGLITKAQAEAIRRAERRREVTPQFTKLGGLVGIHGGGNSSDWTWGCIALADAGIEELWVACPPGTPVEIRK
jgi:murein L,D-transpeptidase YafK